MAALKGLLGKTTKPDDEDVVVIGSDDICDFNPEHILPQPENVLARIRAWLNPTEYDHEGSEYEKHISSHLAGTGDWVYASSVYQEWHEGDSHGILLIRGIPGSGKSVLAASLVEHLKNEGHPVLYFFFRHTIQANHSAAAALRDWLAQILKFSPPLQQELKRCVDIEGVEQLALADLDSHLRVALTHIPKVYCVVDALDEMDQEALEPFLRLLDDLGRWRPLDVKLIMTSRPVAIVEKIMRGVKILDVRLDKQRIEADIAEYIRYRLRNSPIPQDSHRHVQETVLDRADGVFLYAKLALDILSETRTDLHATLRALPTNLAVVYSNLLEEHSKRSGVSPELQQLVLEVVTHATRPLRLLEVADLIDVTQQGAHDLGATKDLIRLACGPLLEILPDETIRVVHHSLTEYLKGSARQKGADNYPIFEPGPTHNRFGLLCISYLRSGCLNAVQVPGQYDDDDLGGFFHFHGKPASSFPPPFTQYAASNWHTHVRRAFLSGHDQTEVNTALDKLLVGDNIEKLAHLAKVDGRCGMSPLGLASAFQLECYVKKLLTSTAPTVVTSQSMKDTAIRYAASNGYGRILNLLLENGADPQPQNEQGMSALHLAVKEKHLNIVKVLLGSGMDPFTDANPGRTFDDSDYSPRPDSSPATYAFTGGDVNMASAFLPYLKTPASLTRALHWAVGARNKPIVQVILQHSLIDINAKQRYQTALHRACAERDADTIEILLKAGADPNVLYQEVHEKDTGYNALHSLAGYGYPMSGNHRKVDEEETNRCFKLVLGAGAKVDQVDFKDRAPLHVARDVAAVRCLVEGGADPNATNVWGEAILHISNDVQIFEYLADKADINMRMGHKGHSLLLSTLAERYATGERQSQRAIRLVELGADLSVVDTDGNSALHYAVKLRNIPLIQKLLERSANVNIKNNKGKTPVHKLGLGAEHVGYQYSSPGFDHDMLEVLLSAGADIDARDNNGETPLFQMICCFNGNGDKENIGLCEKMAEKGARLDVVDHQGRTLLHGAVRHCDDQATLLKFLIARGLDVQQTDNDGNTLWHVVAPRLTKRSARFAFLGELAALGADPQQANASGRTPLHILSSFRPSALQPGSSYYGDGRKTNADDATTFDYFLDLHKDVDCADSQGVTPLHLASTLTEYQTRRLLEAGASLTKATNEGLTSFHLAARSRQANIVGILLGSLESNVNREAALAILGKKDQAGKSALYYACASGRPETVGMLLRAGAPVDTDVYVGSAWHGCVDFEEEQACEGWSRTSDRSSSNDRFEPDCGGVTISDGMRPCFPEPRTHQPNAFPTERLDEIVDLLVIHGIESGRRFIDQALSSAVEKKHDYTVECLLRARQGLGIEEPHPFSDQLSACLQRRRDAINRPPRYGQTAGRLMSLREYGTATQKMLDRDWADDETARFGGSPMLHRLARGGFARILARVIGPEAPSREESQPSEEPGTDNTSSASATETLLAVACQRALPNMDVVRLLVEDKGVNVNAKGPSHPYTRSDTATALHCLVGGGHWWQIEEALPYLLKKGADTEVCDGLGLTPLNAALEAINGPNFSKRAVEILVESGANPNAADKQGGTCLSRAASRREIYQLLISHGAVVTPAAMSAAIKKRDCDLLALMLSNGTDPDLREVGEEVPSWTSPDRRSFRNGRHDPHTFTELYPVELVVSRSREDKSDGKASERMLNLLLEHGADPSARYQKTTILHRVIRRQGLNGTSYGDENRFTRVLLRHPKVDLEARDDQGMTLLLVASCQRAGGSGGKDASKPSLVQVLLELGADARARDGQGRTALHHLMGSRWGHGSPSQARDIASLLQASPELIQAIDDEGKQPIHYAFDPFVDGPAIQQLMAAGADILQAAGKTGDSPLHLLFRGEWHVGLDGKVPTTAQNETNASWRGELLHCFVAAGADVNTRNRAGESPVFGFFRDGTVTTARRPGAAVVPGAVRHRNNENNNDDWIERNRLELKEKEPLVWKFFEDAGVDWKAVNRKGETLLHVVAGGRRFFDSFDGRRLIQFQFLLSKGLDPFHEDRAHRTALDVAAASGAEDILGLFKTTLA